MVALKKNGNGIEIKNDNAFPELLFVCSFLAVIFLLVVIVGISTGDAIGTAEIIFFVVFLTLLLIFTYIDSTKILTVSNDGVTFKSVLKSDYFSWLDVKDFGISYRCRSRHGAYYCLYFSRESQNTKNEYSKKLKGKMIKFVFDANDYKIIRDNVIPYCAEKTTNAPFVGKKK